MSSKKITIVGAGLAGSLLSIYLAKRGFRVRVFERRPDMRREKISAGRSINLAFSARGIHALREVGQLGDVMRQAIPMPGRMIHAIDGGLTFQPYGKDASQHINSISRPGLNTTLMNAAEKAGVEFFFNKKCSHIDLRNGVTSFENTRDQMDIQLSYDPVIAADGAASVVRMAIIRTPNNISYSQQFLGHGYKELSIPPNPDGSHRMEKNALHIWPRGDFMLIALPNPDGSFTCTLFLSHKGEFSFEKLQDENAVTDFFEMQFPDAYELLPTLVDDFFENPTGSLVTVRCSKWYVDNKAVLLGDAAHAIVPFFGQGMNAAFEDCIDFNACLETFAGDWEEVFSAFEKKRLHNSNAIADMALENFIEMRDHTADPKFHLKKKVEAALLERFPDRFIPKYSMVSFHQIPYAVVQNRGEIQERILNELCGRINEVEELDWKKVESLIVEKLEKFKDGDKNAETGE